MKANTARSRSLAATVSLAIVTAALTILRPASAHAAHTLVVDMSSAEPTKTLVVTLYRGQPIVFYFPHPVESAYVNRDNGHFEIRGKGNLVGIMPTAIAELGSATFITDKWNIGVTLIIVDDREDAINQVEFRDIDHRLAIGRDLFYRPPLTPVLPAAPGPAQRAHARVTASRSVGPDLYCEVVIDSQRRVPLHLNLSGIEARLGREPVPGAQLHLINATEPAERDEQNRAFATVLPGERSHGWLMLPGAAERADLPLSVRLPDLSGEQDLEITVSEWRVAEPTTDKLEAEIESLHQFAGTLEAFAGPLRASWQHGQKSLDGVALIAYGDGDGLLKFEVENDGAETLRYARIQVQDPDENDYTERVRIVGRAPEQGIGAIEPGAKLTGSIRFRAPKRLEQTGVVLKLFPADGAAPAKLIFDIDRRGLPGPNLGRSALLAAGGAGVMQLNRDDGSALTSAYGFGAQYIYGVSGNFSLDIGLSLLASGETDIADVARSERLYRLHGGVRFLTRDSGWTPYARVGAGMALVSEKNGDDSSFAFGVFGQVGMGLIRYLAESLVIGAEATGEISADRGSTGMANLFLGIAWGEK
ncbi:MAG: hypothetical protein Tsb0020_21710 [Haliangiales bacterium]